MSTTDTSEKGLETLIMARCWLVSLIGNLCSAVAFPFLLAIFTRFGRS
jgi:hypothetical protein